MAFTDSLKRLLLDLNPAWVLWALVGLGVIGLAISVERWMLFVGLGANVRAQAQRLDELLRASNLSGAIEFLRGSRSPAAAVAIEGLKHAELGPIAAEKAMAGALALQRTRLERGLAFLSTLGNNAPFVGLFGTVIGVIKAFHMLGVEYGAKGDAIDLASKAVMVGVAEALVATAVGLLVAIPAVALNNYFHRRIHEMLASTEALRNLVLAHLHGGHVSPAPAPVPPPGTR